MKAMFFACERIGDGLSPETAYRPWFHGTVDWAGGSIGEHFMGNAFHEDQTVFDAITADSRTAFTLPINVDGPTLSWEDEDVEPTIFGIIVAWVAQNLLLELPPARRRPAEIARTIMGAASGEKDVDPLDGFRIYWE